MNKYRILSQDIHLVRSLLANVCFARSGHVLSSFKKMLQRRVGAAVFVGQVAPVRLNPNVRRKVVLSYIA